MLKMSGSFSFDISKKKKKLEIGIPNLVTI